MTTRAALVTSSVTLGERMMKIIPINKTRARIACTIRRTVASDHCTKVLGHTIANKSVSPGTEYLENTHLKKAIKVTAISPTTPQFKRVG